MARAFLARDFGQMVLEHLKSNNPQDPRNVLEVLFETGEVG